VARETVRAEFGIAPLAPLVLFSGWVTRPMGVIDLAAAFATLSVVSTLTLFAPASAGRAHDVARRCGRRVRLVGYTPVPERYLAAADLLCLPSYREGFGSVVIEAAAAGLPAVGSRIYGVADAIVDGKTGLLFEAGNAADLAAKLSQLLADESMRQHMGAAARERALAEFSQARLVGLLEARYRAILGE
jgi:glycosyltransferase involved in cell wall biosynthesis